MDYDKVPWYCVLCPDALDVYDPVRVCARRLCSGQVPTTVFTPMEYACIGATEEAAIAQEGEDNIEVYHVVHQPLEMAAVHRSAPDGTEDTVRARLFFVACVCARVRARWNQRQHGRAYHTFRYQCYCKLVCERESGRVLGIHILGPSAGEVMQGFAVAMRLGATKVRALAACFVPPRASCGGAG